MPAEKRTGFTDVYVLGWFGFFLFVFIKRNILMFLSFVFFVGMPVELTKCEGCRGVHWSKKDNSA